MLSFPEHDLASLSDLIRSWGLNPCHAGKILRAFYASSGKLDLRSLDIGNSLRRQLAGVARLGKLA